MSSFNIYDIPPESDFEHSVKQCILRLRQSDELLDSTTPNIMSGSGTQYFIIEELPGQVYEVLPVKKLPYTFHKNSRYAGLFSITGETLTTENDHSFFPSLNRILALVTPPPTQFAIDFAHYAWHCNPRFSREILSTSPLTSATSKTTLPTPPPSP